MSRAQISSRRRKRAGRATQGRGWKISVPPQIEVNIKFKHRFRFVATSVSQSTIFRSDVLNVLFVNFGTTNNYRVLGGVKIDRLECWAPPGGGTIAFEWLGSTGPSSEVSDTTMSTAQPAHIVATPPSQSTSGFWSLSGTNETEQLMITRAPTGAILDVWLNMVMQDIPFATVNVNTAASGTAGQFYVGAFDGAGATPMWTPVSHQTLS